MAEMVTARNIDEISGWRITAGGVTVQLKAGVARCVDLILLISPYIVDNVG